MSQIESNFYKAAAKYWATIPATIDGVLGGFGHISNADIKGSKAFIEYLFAQGKATGKTRALDCGAGIGRVSTQLLMPIFEKVDLVEQDTKFALSAKAEFGDNNPKLGKIYVEGVQNFKPEHKYDLVWCQWITGHLKDYDLIDFLKILKGSLTGNGVIVIKDNITSEKTIEYDEEDSSVTRPLLLMKAIFKEAKLTVIHQRIQDEFPQEIYPVFMFALAPSEY